MNFNKMMFAEKSKLGQHVLIQWMMDAPHPLSFAPAMSFFVFGFRDLLLLLKYEAPKNQLENAVNLHCNEDLQHWQLYLKDLETLNVDQSNWGKKSTNALRQIWSEENWKVRLATYRLMSMGLQEKNAAVRLVMIECLELAFAVFIEAVRASNSSDNSKLVYFGDLHFFEESAHENGSWIDGEHKIDLNSMNLSDEDSNKSVMIIVESFAWFHLMFTSWYKQRDSFKKEGSRNMSKASQAKISEV